jgi:hypothetical protein
MWRAYRGWLDAFAVILVGLVLLFPEAGVVVHPALERAGTHELDRIAELQAHMVGHPDDAEAAIELSELFLWQWRPDWSLATLGGVLTRHPDDFRLHFGMAVAHADRFDFRSAKASIDSAEAACQHDPVRCSEANRVRMSVFDRAVGDVLAQHVNPLKDPNRAKEIIDSVMHTAKIPRPEDAHRLFPAPPRPAPGKQKPSVAAPAGH